MRFGETSSKIIAAIGFLGGGTISYPMTLPDNYGAISLLWNFLISMAVIGLSISLLFCVAGFLTFIWGVTVRRFNLLCSPSTESRLATIKDLLDRKVITQQEYEERRRAILGSL